MKSRVIDGVVWLLNKDGSLFATEESIRISAEKLAETIDEDILNHYLKEGIKDEGNKRTSNGTG